MNDIVKKLSDRIAIESVRTWHGQVETAKPMIRQAAEKVLQEVFERFPVHPEKTRSFTDKEEEYCYKIGWLDCKEAWLKAFECEEADKLDDRGTDDMVNCHYNDKGHLVKDFMPKLHPLTEKITNAMNKPQWADIDSIIQEWLEERAKEIIHYSMSSDTKALSGALVVLNKILGLEEKPERKKEIEKLDLQPTGALDLLKKINEIIDRLNQA